MWCLLLALTFSLRCAALPPVESLLTASFSIFSSQSVLIILLSTRSSTADEPLQLFCPRILSNLLRMTWLLLFLHVALLCYFVGGLMNKFSAIQSTYDNTHKTEKPVSGRSTNITLKEPFVKPWSVSPDTDEQRLLKKLMKNYEKHVRPIVNASNKVTVKMGLTLAQIFDMDEKNQVLVTNVWLDQEWVDFFLHWEPDKFGHLDILRVPCSKIWLPDIVLYNNAAEYTDGQMQAHAMVHSNGRIFWPVPTKLQSSCKMDVTYFPFDSQTCDLKFGSWTYDGFQVDIVKRTNYVDLSNYMVNGEWELLGISIVRNVVYYNCCDEPYPDVTFYIHIKRRILYYMYIVMIPCILMSALTVLVFCLPPDSGEKVALGVTVLLAFSVFMLSIAENLPETSEFVPLISIYLTCVMSLTSVSVILTVFILNLHHREPNIRPVPTWLQMLAFRFLAKYLCLGLHEEFMPAEIYENGSNRSRGGFSLKMNLEDLTGELQSELTTLLRKRNKRTKPMISDPVAARAANHLPTIFESPAASANHAPFSRAESSQMPPEMAVIEEADDILIALRNLVNRHEQDETKQVVIREWKKVGQVFDRLLFWIFFIGTTFATLFLLVILPSTKSRAK